MERERNSSNGLGMKGLFSNGEWERGGVGVTGKKAVSGNDEAIIKVNHLFHDSLP